MGFRVLRDSDCPSASQCLHISQLCKQWPQEILSKGKETTQGKQTQAAGVQPGGYGAWEVGVAGSVLLSGPTYITWVGECGTCGSGVWSGLWGGRKVGKGGRGCGGKKVLVSLELFSFRLQALLHLQFQREILYESRLFNSPPLF